MASVAPLDTQDVLAPFEAALSRGLVREAEVFLAGLALMAGLLSTARVHTE